MANNFNNKDMYDSMLRWLRLIAHRTARHFQNPNAKHLSSTVKSTCLKCTTRAHRMRSAYHHRLHHLTDFFCFVVVALATGRGRLIHRRIYLTRSIIIMQNYNCVSMSHKHSWHVQFMCWKLTVLWTPTLVPDLADCTPFWTTKRRICPWVATYPFYSNPVHWQKPVETFNKTSLEQKQFYNARV